MSDVVAGSSSSEKRPNDGVSPLHPHEPDVLPVIDPEGRCLVCKLTVEAERRGFEAGQSRTSEVIAQRIEAWPGKHTTDGKHAIERAAAIAREAARG